MTATIINSIICFVVGACTAIAFKSETLAEKIATIILGSLIAIPYVVVVLILFGGK